MVSSRAGGAGGGWGQWLGRAAGAADVGARTGWGLAEVKGALSAAGSPACVDVFSTLSAELAVSDSAAPKTATAAAEMVTFLACETSQGRSLRGSSLRGVSAAGDESVSTGPTVAMAIVSATGVIVFFGRDIRQGRSRGSVDGVSPESSRPTVASAAPRARASWVSPESETGIGSASAIGWVTSSRSASAPTRYKLSGNQPSRRKTVRSQSMRSSAVSQRIRDGGAHGTGPGSDDHDGRGVGLEDAQSGRGVIGSPDLDPPCLGGLTQRDGVNVVETQVCQ